MSTYNEMKKKAESDQNRIELRSEKVRNMIGEMPSFLIRWGNTILVVIFVLLALAYALTIRTCRIGSKPYRVA